MLRIVISIISVLAIVAVGCGTPQPTSAPAAPEDVLSVWHSPPSPQGYPPDIAGEVHLGKYTSSNYEYVSGDSFFLQNCQWVDIVVKSKNIRVKFSDDKPGTVHFGVEFDYLVNCEESSYGPDLEDVGGEFWGPTVSPFIGKILYGHPMCRETRIGKDMIYSIAIRFFVRGGDCNSNLLGSDGSVGFINYNVEEEADISYEVYKLDTTPGWGYEGEYWNNVLAPWILQGRSESEVPESEIEQLYEEWCEQFK